MAFSVQGKCLSCDYESPPLNVRDGRYVAAVCETCNELVNARLVPFRFEWPICPQCETTLTPSGLLDGRYISAGLKPGEPSEYVCPRCREGMLAFTSVENDNPTPQLPPENAVVHGLFLGNELILSSLRIARDDVDIEGCPQAEPNRPMEFVVSRANAQSEGAKLALKFTRYLAAETDPR